MKKNQKSAFPFLWFLCKVLILVGGVVCIFSMIGQGEDAFVVKGVDFVSTFIAQLFLDFAWLRWGAKILFFLCILFLVLGSAFTLYYALLSMWIFVSLRDFEAPSPWLARACFLFLLLFTPLLVYGVVEAVELAMKFWSEFLMG